MRPLPPMHPTTSILLPAYRAEHLLRDIFCRSLARNTPDLAQIELIIYDNGGNGADLDFLRAQKFANITVLGDGTNVGLNVALNACAKVARGHYFFLPHTDMYLMPGWHQALLSAAKGLPPKSFMLCSRSIEPRKSHTDYHVIRDFGATPQSFREEALLHELKDYVDPGPITGYRMPFFMHRQLWERMGGVDPHYFSYCTDDDLVQTAYDVGVRNFWMIGASLVYHLQGSSNRKQEVDRGQDEPYEYFINKWKGKYPEAEDPNYWHPKLIPWYRQVYI